MTEPTCPECGFEIDPDVCHCGTLIKDHDMGSGHSPVPLGCHCGYAIEWSYRDHRPDVEQWFCVSYQGGSEVITWVTTRDRVSYQIIGFGRVHLVSAAELNKTLCHHKLPYLTVGEFDPKLPVLPGHDRSTIQ